MARGGRAAALEPIESESRARDASLEKGLRELETGMRELRLAVLQVAAEVHELRVKVEQNSADIRDLSTRMAVLSRLEERVAALEKRNGLTGRGAIGRRPAVRLRYERRGLLSQITAAD